MTKEEKCEAGCKTFYGREIRHDKNCVFYPESLSEMLDNLQSNSIESLIDRNYNAQIRRGQINDETDLIDCIEKIREEFNELYDSYAYDCGIESCDPKELSDIILTCFTTAKHFNIDIMQVLSDKVDFNEKRED